jgi:hypothetical protein
MKQKPKPVKGKGSPKKEVKSLLEQDSVIYILLGIVILIIAVARIHLLPVPFERDEGEYAYAGRLIQEGFPPYQLAYNMKFPGTYYMYALIMTIFGKSVTGVHFGLLCISAASILLVFLVSKNFVSKVGAVIAAASFGILSVSMRFSGQAAHATHFVIFFALLGMYLLLKTYTGSKQKMLCFFLPGLFFSLAVICKQSGIFLAFAGFIIILAKEIRIVSPSKIIKHLALFSAGLVLPLLLMFLYFYLTGNFSRFWFWTVKYLSKYGTQIPAVHAFASFKQGFAYLTSDYSAKGFIALWILALAGIPMVFLRKDSSRNKIILISFFFFSLLTIIPGFYFRNHYFITLLPAIGLMIAVLFDYLNEISLRRFNSPAIPYILLLCFLVLTGTGIGANADYLFKEDPKLICKQIYKSNPFVESLEIARFLEAHTTRTDKIAVLGSEPQLFFYSNRHSATGYIYTYNLVEIHPYALQMQKEMAHEIEVARPKFIVMVQVGTSWLAYPDCEKFLSGWTDEYVNNNYHLVAAMDMYNDKISSLITGEDLKNYQPQSQELIYITERNQP